MIVAAQQPNYLPWCGYFYKMAHCDIFVILDDVQFTKNNYQNRTRIKGPKGPIWLTQPVLHSGRAWQSTEAVEFDARIDWRTKHLKTLAANYARSAHAEAMLAACRDWLDGKSPLLAETNTRIIQGVARLLGLRTKVVVSSTLDLQLTKADRLAEICRLLGADVYLSGRGGRNYQDEEQFHERGIKLAYSDFAPSEYRQLWGPFWPGLSIADALFNLGPTATAALVRSFATEA
jgi:hypothetical protein